MPALRPAIESNFDLPVPARIQTVPNRMSWIGIASLLLMFGVANSLSAQIAAIHFNPANSAADNATVTAANQELSQLGDTGRAMANMANHDIDVYVTINSSEVTRYEPSFDGQHRIYLNNNPANKFLDSGSLGAAIGHGEDPPSRAITWGHELAHAITRSSHPNSTREQREADAIHNYENDLRAADGKPARGTYGGQALEANTSFWQGVKNFFKDIWE